MEYSVWHLVTGLLLYGPPGTGKTLIARQIGKMLNAHEPKIGTYLVSLNDLDLLQCSNYQS